MDSEFSVSCIASAAASLEKLLAQLRSHQKSEQCMFLKEVESPQRESSLNTWSIAQAEYGITAWADLDVTRSSIVDRMFTYNYCVGR